MSNNDSAQLAKLIGLVYETASDPDLWPSLLEAMTLWAETHTSSSEAKDALESPTAWIRPWFEESSPVQQYFGDGHGQLLSLLGPHFVRAHDLHHQITEAESERNTLEQITDQLPLGLAVVSARGRVISINATMLTTLRGNPHLMYTAGHLVSHPPTALTQTLDDVLTNRSERSLCLQGDGRTTVVWASRLSAKTPKSQSKVLILCAPSVNRRIPEAGLRELYGLTEAEARLTSRLAQGNTLEKHAQEMSISINTAKTLLKRVFTKVGVCRQTDLMRTLYASPLWLAPSPLESRLPGTEASDEGSPDRTHQLADGRLLSYSDCGPSDGLPVFLMHGIAGSRRLFAPTDRSLHDLGIRLIVPERPGCGHSTAQSGRSILDWPPDLMALANHLGLGEFVVLGYSSGTPYALASAWSNPHRVKRVVLVASMPEVKGLSDLAQFQPTFRMTLSIARLAPSVAPAVVRVMIRGIRSNVYRYIEDAISYGTNSDQQVFEDPVFRRWYAQSLLSATRQGEEHIAHEVALAVSAWGFKVEEITAPVEIWHGDGDHLVSPEGAKRLARQLPNARLRLVFGAGHYLVYSHWREILKNLKASASQQ